MRVLDIESGQELEDTLERVKYSSLVWAADSSGIYYSRFPAPQEGAEFQSLNKNQKIYFHAVGSAQEAANLVYSRDDHPDWIRAGATPKPNNGKMVSLTWISNQAVTT